jgi:hypothetical protein
MKHLNRTKKIASITLAAGLFTTLSIIPHIRADAQDTITQGGPMSLTASVHIDAKEDKENTMFCVVASEVIDGQNIPRNISGTAGEHIVQSNSAIDVAHPAGIAGAASGAIAFRCDRPDGQAPRDITLNFPNPGYWLVQVRYKENGEFIGCGDVPGVLPGAIDEKKGEQDPLDIFATGSLTDANAWFQYGPRTILTSKVLYFTSDLRMKVDQEIVPIDNDQIISQWNLTAHFSTTGDTKLLDPKAICRITNPDGSERFSATGVWDSSRQTSSWHFKITAAEICTATITVPSKPNLTYVVDSLGNIRRGDSENNSTFVLPNGTVNTSSDSVTIKFNLENKPNIELEYEAINLTSEKTKKGKLAWNQDAKSLSATFDRTENSNYKILVRQVGSQNVIATLFTDTNTLEKANCTATKATSAAFFRDALDENGRISMKAVAADIPESEIVGFLFLKDGKAVNLVFGKADANGYAQGVMFFNRDGSESNDFSVEVIGKDSGTLYKETRTF